MEKLRLLSASLLLISLISCTKTVSKSVQIGDFIVADRNVGAQEEGEALNYTNNKEQSDNDNSEFAGGYYTWEEAQTICPDGWRLPTQAEVNIMEDAMQFADRAAYLADGSGNRCYFPLSGRNNDFSSESGSYWSTGEFNRQSAYYLSVTPFYCDVPSQRKSLKFTVRCVKTVL